MIKNALQILCGPAWKYGVVELRALGAKQGTISGYFDANHLDEMVDHAEGLSGECQGVYVTPNPINPECLARSANRCQGWAKHTTKDSEILRRLWIRVDCDPVRPSGISATDEEQEFALNRAKDVRDYLSSLGWPLPLFGSSGNGADLQYRIDLPVNDGGVVRDTLRTLSKMFSDERVEIDAGIHNPARITKLFFTKACKGDDTPGRPHRIAEILEVPDELEIVAQHLLRPKEPESAGPQKPDERYQTVISQVKTYLETVGADKHLMAVEDSEKFTLFVFDTCFIQGEPHEDGRNSAILVWKHNATIGGKCFHESHGSSNWTKLQGRFGLTFKAFLKQTDEPAQDNLFKDPLELAKQIPLELAFFHGAMYVYERAGSWRPIDDKELAPHVRETIQAQFDLNDCVAPIGKKFIGDVSAALQQHVLHKLPYDIEEPFWFRPHDGWDPLDLLCFSNGILNIRRFIADVPCFIEPTPNLYITQNVGFDYDPDAAVPAAWLAFLESLGQDQAWIDLLHQVMGYSLWLGWDMQKYFHFVGPPRSGKGVIADAMIKLAGGRRAMHSAKLVALVSRFGLQPVLGKRLLFFPEISLPERSANSIVGVLKAITGSDAVPVDRKNRTEISTRIRARIWMSTNEFIALPDNSGALNARVVPIHFTKSFVGREDRKLGEKIALGLPGLMNLCLEAVQTLYRQGNFKLSEASQSVLDDLQDESAPLKVFVRENCTLDSKKGVQCPALYQTYINWAQQNNEICYSEKEFFRELKKAEPGVQKTRLTTGATTWKGMQIVETRFDIVSERARVYIGIIPSGTKTR